MSLAEGLLEGAPERTEKGAYGTVYLYPECVQKDARHSCHATPEFYKPSPYTDSVSQSLLLDLFTRLFVGTNRTPHICPMVAPSYFKRNGDSSIYMKRAIGGSLDRFILKMLRTHAHEQDTAAIDELVRLLLFQMAYTLATIHLLFPDFRHNDLKLSNVVLERASTEGYSTYAYNGTHRWSVPNLGVHLMMIDFDMACIRGIVDNEKVIDMAITNPQYDINWLQNQSTDLYFFAKSLFLFVHRRISPQLKVLLQTIFHGKLLLHNAKVNFNRGTPQDTATMPTPLRFLLDERLFGCYRYAGGAPIMYAATPFQKAELPFEVARPKFRLFYRLVPTLGVGLNLYFEKLPLHPLYKEKEPNHQLFLVTRMRLQHEIMECYEIPMDSPQTQRIMNAAEANMEHLMSYYRIPMVWQPAYFLMCFFHAIIQTHSYTVGGRYYGMDGWSKLLNEYYSEAELYQIALQYSHFTRK